MSAGRPLPLAAIFDCDGTLADTEPLAWAAVEEELARHNYQLTNDDRTALFGRTYNDLHRYLSSRTELPPSAVFEAACVEREIALNARAEPYEDALRCLTDLLEHGVKVAVASSSPRRRLDLTLARLPLPTAVTTSVSAEDVRAGKPNPEPYLQAAHLLQVMPAGCVAVEDSPAGVSSALAAGMSVVGVERGEVRLDDATVRCRQVSIEIVSEAWHRRGNTT